MAPSPRNLSTVAHQRHRHQHQHRHRHPTWKRISSSKYRTVHTNYQQGVSFTRGKNRVATSVMFSLRRETNGNKLKISSDWRTVHYGASPLSHANEALDNAARQGSRIRVFIVDRKGRHYRLRGHWNVKEKMQGYFVLINNAEDSLPQDDLPLAKLFPRCT